MSIANNKHQEFLKLHDEETLYTCEESLQRMKFSCPISLLRACGK